MKTCRIATVLVALLAVCSQCAPAQGSQTAETARYYVVLLRPAADRKTLSQEESNQIQAAHMANIHKMADDGILFAAGPFDDMPHTISGIFVLRTGSLEEAQSIAAKDPTVVEHRNTVDVHAWDGPAGIGNEYFRLHRLDPKTSENMQVHPFGLLAHGPAWKSRRDREELLRAHERYLLELRRQGKLSAAGPVELPDDLMGLVIFRAIQFEEAQRLLDADPAVQAGVIHVEYHHWWCSDHVLPW